MKLRVHLLTRAQEDADHIYLWLLKRSPAGASAWYAALLAEIDSLGDLAPSCSQAPEATRLGEDLRQAIFKTRRSRAYRLVFVLDGEVVRILRIRGPGQQPISKRDLAE